MNTSANSSEQWNAIKDIFNNVDSANDAALPAETIIYYSKTKLLLALLLRLPLTLVMAALLYFIVNNTKPALTLIIILAILRMVFLVSAGKVVLRMFDRTPQLVISDKGIQTKPAGSQSWDNIMV